MINGFVDVWQMVHLPLIATHKILRLTNTRWNTGRPFMQKRWIFLIHPHNSFMTFNPLLFYYYCFLYVIMCPKVPKIIISSHSLCNVQCSIYASNIFLRVIAFSCFFPLTSFYLGLKFKIYSIAETTWIGSFLFCSANQQHCCWL